MTWFQKPPIGTPLDWENPLNRGVVFAPAMNEGHGDKVQDLSLNGNDGVLHNFAFPSIAPSGWNPIQTGIGLNFDGTNDYINCGAAANLDNSGACTLSATVVPSGVISQYSIIGRDAPLYFGFFDDSIIRLRHLNVGDGITEVAYPISTGEEINVTATWDGANTAIYADGVYIGGQAASGIIGATADLIIGNVTAGGGWNFQGSIDQPRIINRAWSAKEVMNYAINPWQVYLDEDD